jgi:DNA-binding CsgD family transcriptional regulator
MATMIAELACVISLQGEQTPNRNVYQSSGHLFIARSRTSGPAAGWESLTATERAVSLLVADGLTNGAVARRLYISPHTVNTHLRHVFAKLGVPNRVALAAEVYHSIK